MTQLAHVLDNPLVFPLQGSRLIEASAGTGKTYTIAALYVRLVLQHGAQGLCFNRELLPKDILVMTFTRAATAELADRIRARLSEAAQFFRSPKAESEDAFLHNLKDDYREQGCTEAEFSRLARRLELAAESMDESAVYTINGWCQKMLTEHAFASGSLFEQEVQTDDDALKLNAAEDYFRRFVYGLDAETLNTVLPLLGTPEQLMRAMGRSGSEITTTDAYPSIAEMRHGAVQQARAEVSALKDKYRGATVVLELIEALPDQGNKLRKEAARVLRDWLCSGAIAIASPSQSKQLNPAALSKKFGNRLPVAAELFADYEADAKQSKVIEQQADNAVLQHASGFMQARFQELKAQAAIMGFDDMLTRLRDALHGPNGAALAQTIRRQFPVALVDEFQDTDPVQFNIFDTIYRIAENDPNTGIFLIGDPKQAIYSFRSADIFTYLKARQATQGRHYNLSKNFRSSHAMVDAVNTVFAHADATTQDGAFLYQQEIPFVEVAAQGQKKVLKGADGEPMVALHWHVGAEPAKRTGDYRKQAAATHANQIAELLNSEQAGFYEGDARTPVAAKDIAVLVANANEARLMRAELSQRGVRSVYLSESDSVYAQPVAVDVLAIVQACAQPLNASRVRRALATPLLGQPLSVLVDLQEQELAWEAAVERFVAYHQRWQRFGILAALQRLLHDYAVPARLLADPNEGERQLADALHLCELLQQASMTLEGMARLEAFFAEQVQTYQATGGFNGGSAKRTKSEALQLRLESDAELVKVVTYFKAKGLQYPLVFIPFASYTAQGHHRFQPFKFPISYQLETAPGERVQQWAWSRDDKAGMAVILHETLAEDLRKMYVAFTRAEFATFATLQAVGDPQRNPLFYLLYGNTPLKADQADVLAQAHRIWGPHPQMRIYALAPEESVMFVPAPNPKAEWIARSFQADLKARAWWLSSYSALSYGGANTAPETPSEMNTLEGARESDADTQDPQVRPNKPQRGEGRIHHLPKGAGPGTFLHTLLEDAAEVGFAKVVHAPTELSALLDQRVNSASWQDYRPALADWLAQYLAVPLPLASGTFSLAELTTYKAEPEFWFEARQVNTAAIDALINQYIQPGAARPALALTHLNGMLKGFIDLVFEHQGRYYVADYKSNWLGHTDMDYSHAAMRKKILASRYDLQYVIYTLALHKLLKSRLGDAYDYDTHMGGAVYLFLRGHHADTRGAFFDRPPRVLIETLEQLFLAQGAEHA